MYVINSYNAVHDVPVCQCASVCVFASVCVKWRGGMERKVEVRGLESRWSTLALCSSFVLLRVVVVVEEQVLGVLVAVEHVRVVVVEVLKYNMVVSEGCLLLLYVWTRVDIWTTYQSWLLVYLK